MCDCRCHKKFLHPEDILADSIRVGDVVETKDHSQIYTVTARDGDFVWVQKMMLVGELLFFGRRVDAEDTGVRS